MARITIDALMQQTGIPFGTSGIRGLATSLTDQVCYLYATAFFQYVQSIQVPSSDASPDNRLIAISGDLRSSTSRIIRAVVRAAQDFGLIALDCGRFPTPALAHYAIQQQIPAIMVTGSHVSEDRNGLKFFIPSGEILKSDEKAIRDQNVELVTEIFDDTGNLRHDEYPHWGATDDGAMAQAYYSRYVDSFPANCLEGIRIGFLAHSTVARDILGDMYESLGAEVVRMGRIERFIPIDTEAVSMELTEYVRQWATMGHFDVILSADGDGDRPLIFDEQGELIPGDIAGMVTAMFLNADTVVTPITSNTALEIAWIFPKIIRTKVGSAYVLEGMNQARQEGGNLVVGYEANGGFMINSPIPLLERFQKMGIPESPKNEILLPLPTRDPAIVHLAMMLTAKQLKKPYSVFHSMFPQRVTKSERIVDFPTELACETLARLQTPDGETYPQIETAFSEFGQLTGVDLTDGLRMTFGNKDIIHLRPSGNAPEFRCYVETESEQRSQEILHVCLGMMKSWYKTN